MPLEHLSSDAQFDRVLRLLDAEIEGLRSDDARTGLTVWVLAAASGAVSYLAIGVWSSSALDESLVGKWLVGLSIIAYTGVAGVFAAVTSDTGVPGRVRLARDSMQRQRLPSLLLSVAAGVLAVLAWQHRAGVQVWAARVTTFLLALGAVLYAVGLIMSFTEFPLPHTEQADNRFWIALPYWGIWLLLTAYMSTAYLSSVTPLASGGRSAELEFSMLCITAAGLAVLLGYQLPASPQLRELSKLRRDLLRGDLEPDDACHAAEIALLGSDALGVIRRNVEIAERSTRKLYDHVTHAVAIVQKVESLRSRGEALSEQDLEEFREKYEEVHKQAVRQGGKATTAIGKAAEFYGGSLEEIDTATLPSRATGLLQRLQAVSISAEEIVNALRQVNERFGAAAGSGNSLDDPLV
jgi:hypothetical protein